MDEVTKLKAEVYDLIAQGEAIQRAIAERNQKIAELLNTPSQEPQAKTK